VTVQESQAIVAQAQSGGQHVDYWVRCLPHDFPGMVAEFFPEAGTPSPGYYLIGDEWPIPPNPAYAFILDSHAVPVWYLAQPNTGIFNANTGAFDVDSQVDGGVSFITWTSTSSESPFHLWQFSPVGMTDISSTGWALDPHELQHLSNGDWLLFTDQVQPGVDMTGYGDAGFNGPSQSILPCDILEVDGTGNVVWKWIGTDHLDAVKDNVVPGYQAGPDRRAYADPFHCNSIDVDPANGNLLVSTRMTNSVFYIEKSSGKILWKMGGQTFTKDSAAYVPVTDGFNAAHDARLLPGWSSKCGGTGQISIFDDSSFDSGTARGVIYDVNVGVDDGSGTCPPAGATPSWQYKGLGTSFIMGSFRVMPDGDRA
jgi:hypothetical protein